MSYPLSDEDSSDSDNGVRFKTTNTRDKNETFKLSYSVKSDKIYDKYPEKYETKHKSKTYEKKDKYRNDRSSSSKNRKHKVSDDYHISKRKKTELKFDEKQRNESDYSESSSLKSKNSLQSCGKRSECKEKVSFGPSLPPISNINHVKNDSTYGPSVPSHLNKKVDKSIVNEKIIGPTLPPHFENVVNVIQNEQEKESDSEEDLIGPLPIEESRNTDLEERALEFKLGLLNRNNKESTSREEWMLELPEIRAPIQLGPRKFRTKEMPDITNRSAWTDTPKDKATKKTKELDLKMEAKLKEIKDKDMIQEKIIEKQKKQTINKSLVELHHEKLAKKAKEKLGSTERRPFNRDIDLKINKFDSSQTKIAIKKAQLLDSKFASGQSKFL